MSRIHETRHRSWHKTFIYKCRLDTSVCNHKKRWNNDKCRCECKELVDVTKADVMINLFGILVYVNVNVINYAILENI